MNRLATAQLRAQLDRLGRLRFLLLGLLFSASLVWLFGGLVTSWSWHPPGLVNDTGSTMGRDFVAVWSAARLAYAGEPAAPYDRPRLDAAEETTIGAPSGGITWFYPPGFLLLVLPLALLPYLVAAALWLVVPFLAFARLLRRVAPHPLAWLAALIFPGTAQSLISVQNGVISAALIAGGLLSIERRPLLAGLCFGALGLKPQIAAAAFFALLFGRYWRALATALAATLALDLASLLIWGPEPWHAFVKGAGEARGLLETGGVPWERMMTVFAAARLAGLGLGGAYALQISMALGALAVIAWLWWRRAPPWLRGSVLIAGIPLTTPYAYDYDLVMLLLPIGWLTREGIAGGFLRGEPLLLAAIWACPVGGWFLAQSTGVQPTPALLCLLLVAILRRAGISVDLRLPVPRQAQCEGRHARPG